jgi:hypothetical protein
MDEQKVDYSKLPPDLLKKLTEAEKRSPQYQQLQAIQDIADMVQELLNELADNKQEKTWEKMGALLTDMRTSLHELNHKEAPDSPDYSTPIVKALNQLEQAFTKELKRIDISPKVQVGSPNVTVPKPDLSGIEKLLKQEVPKAFKAAIALIPAPEKDDNSDLLEAFAGISEQLQSIDTATRMKPLPGSMKVTHPDGTYVDSPSLFRELDDIVRSNPDTNGNYQTMRFKKSGSTIYTLTFTFDSSSNVTEISRT